MLGANGPYNLPISDGNTKTYTGSCIVTNSSAANAALSQLVGFQVFGQDSCPCQAAPDPTRGYVVGLKLNARVSLRDGTYTYTYYLKGCDATYTYRATALANGETFAVSVDVISGAAMRAASWAVFLACLVAAVAAAL